MSLKFRKNKLPIKVNPKRPTPRQIMIKIVDFKTESQRQQERDKVTYEGAHIRLSADFSLKHSQKGVA